MVTTALVETPPHSSSGSSSKSQSSLSCSETGSNGSESGSNGSDSGHPDGSHPSTPRTGSHFTGDDQDSGILGELCNDSFSSGSDSGFCHNQHNHDKKSFCSRCSTIQDEDEVKIGKRGRKSVKMPKVPKRRHSRASSVDRREIFNKYIQRPGELSDSVRPFTSDDPELNSTSGEKDRNQDEFMLMQPNATKLATNPPNPREILTATSGNSGQHSINFSANESQSSGKKEFRLVRLAFLTGNAGSCESQLGIFIARQNQLDIGCFGYFVAHIVPNGLVKR